VGDRMMLSEGEKPELMDVTPLAASTRADIQLRLVMPACLLGTLSRCSSDCLPETRPRGSSGPSWLQAFPVGSNSTPSDHRKRHARGPIAVLERAAYPCHKCLRASWNASVTYCLFNPNIERVVARFGDSARQASGSVSRNEESEIFHEGISLKTPVETSYSFVSCYLPACIQKWNLLLTGILCSWTDVRGLGL
jgi:hypothetical protein